MTAIKGTIPDELDAEFRREVAKRFGMRHGALSKAIEEAIRQWLGSNSNETANSETDTISYIELKNRLIGRYPNKFCILKDNEVVAIADSIIEATHEARMQFPDHKKFKIVHTASKGGKQAQLGWRLRRKKKT